MYILSIDPGTKNLGISVLDLTLHNVSTTEVGFNLEILDTRTVGIENLVKLKYSALMEERSLRELKVKACYDTILKMVDTWTPAIVISEAPYMGRFPTAFGALVECLQAVREAVMDYDVDLPFVSIDPATVKKMVGVKGNSGDKNAMTKALHKLFPDRLDLLAHLDEHAIDSLGVGYAWSKLYLEDTNKRYWG